ncbi:porin [Caballeronia sp. M23-90]
MKRFVFVGLSLSAILSASQARAQSSVTLYGLLDEGINYTNNAGGHSIWEMQSGFAQGSRWGLKGVEDLGGGMRAIFQLENGFDVSTGRYGQGGRQFGRQAYIGVQSTLFGTVTLGRQYDSVVDFVAPLTANGNWAGYLFSHPFDNDNTDNSFRLNNSVKYTSSNYAGLTFGGLYGFSNQTNFSDNRSYSVGAQYAIGPLTVAASYMQINNPGVNVAGSLANDTTFTAARQRVWGGGVNYTLFTSTTVGFVYTHTDLNAPTAISGYLSAPFANAPSTLKFDTYEVNVKHQFTSSFYVGAMCSFTQGKFNSAAGEAKPKWNQFGLMADYDLSPRTDVYVQGLYQKVSGSPACQYEMRHLPWTN